MNPLPERSYFWVLLLFCLLIFLLVKWHRNPLGESLLKSSVFYVSCLVLAFSCYSFLILRGQEAYYSEQDHLLHASPGSFIELESETVRAIRERVQKIWT